MKFKIPWTIFAISLLTVLPFKIYLSVVGSEFDKSLVFGCTLGVLYLVFLGFVFMNREKVTYFRSYRDPFVGTVSLVLSACFFANSVSYVVCESNPNMFLQLLILCIASAMSGVTFLLISLNYFIGKNMFKKAQVTVFFPIIWFVARTISFLSISQESPDQYDVALCSFILLFFLYHTQIYVSATEKNIGVRLFAFGLPAVVATFMYCIPEFVYYIKNTNLVYSIDFSTMVTEFMSGIYVLFLMTSLQAKGMFEKANCD